ncbi:PepSY-associated TM helix domain-containing protein [Marilutibacter chinensis]|uniref:PepSY-associated TM helix domain-containing protein n=1 Tax=Marilutibacter chinensis TaxID=2912247 RepID=A0ABS9HW83_9GAMM|nr:PepSY-associated TM helix domain-containing protein [Lysobacter chinensis]MCF7222439.1 PepSY-associated TM helix domain-containing protein [Lysobacter chinensis]
MSNPTHADLAAAQQRRSYWLRTLHQWHWISAAVSLVVLLLFTVTGITLNHAAQIEAEPSVSSRNGTLPASVLKTLQDETAADAPLPNGVRRWLDEELGIRIDGRAAEWSDGEVYVSLPRPGGDAWLAIDRDSGGVEYELTTRGVIAWLNDLHKGRNTGAVWRWFIDVFALACLLFALSGLWLLQLHARQRGATWPLVAAGLAVPLVLVILFMH